MENNKQIGERLKELRLYLKLTQAQFAAKLGIQDNSTISKYEKGIFPIAKKAELELFTSMNVSREWLMEGSGEMFKTPVPVIKNEAFELGDIHNGVVETTKSGNTFIDIGNGLFTMLTPLVDEFAYAGYPLGYKDQEYIDELPKHPVVVSRRHKGLYMSFTVRGDSMDSGERDAICNGDIVTGRNIEKIMWKSKFHLHKFEDYIIVHREGIIVKQIIDHDVENGVITIHCLNKDKSLYPDDIIHLKDVEQIFNITQVTKFRGNK